MKYTVADLFAGAGGLSFGFSQAHNFEIKVAFENNPYARKTYKRNHPKVEVFDDVCTADYRAIKQKYGKIDVVIGGPPCQGFSNANRQKTHTICQNNMLVKQYVRAIIELQPKAFVMENVSMLISNIHRFYMIEGDEKLIEEYKIPVINSEIVLLDKIQKFDGAIELISNNELTQKYLWSEADYSIINIIYKQGRNHTKLVAALRKYKFKLMRLSDKLLSVDNGEDYIFQHEARAAIALKKYYAGEMLPDEVVTVLEPLVMIQQMLGKANEIHENNLLVNEYNNTNNIIAKVRSFAVLDYIQHILGSAKNGYVIDCGILCAADFGAPQKRMRFVVMGVKKNVSSKIALPKGYVEADEYATVRDAIADIANVQPIYELKKDIGITLDTPSEISKLGRKLRDSDTLYNHIVTRTGETALTRFAVLKQGENFHNLDSSMKENTYTDINRTQNTIYWRLKYDEPSGTVVNIRKSMWVHPEFNRAVSIREAARLQTFPDSFVFEGTKDSQYQQVGNAVPPILAKAIAKKIAKVLDKSTGKK